MTYTNSEPPNGNRLSNGNHRKQNGTLSVFKNSSHGDINVGQGHANGKGLHVNNNANRGYISDDFANLKNVQTKSCFNLSTAQESVSNGQIQSLIGEQEIVKSRSVDNVKQESEGPVLDAPAPPRRPLRKKKSSRGRNDMPEKVPTQDYKQTLGQMAMEYSSSSPDMSPRQTGSGLGAATNMTQQNEAEQNQSNVQQENSKRIIGDKDNVNCGEESKVIVNISEPEVVLISSSSSEISPVSKHSSNNKCDTSSEGPPRDISLFLGRNEFSNQSKIVELGAEENDKDLEIEKVEFDSQTRKFEKPDLHSACFEDTFVNEKVQSYLAKSKFDDIDSGEIVEEPKSLVSDLLVSDKTLIGRESETELTASASKSRSLESLEDIDRLLKQQVIVIKNLSDTQKPLNNASL